jgi:hypothetical protein
MVQFNTYSLNASLFTVHFKDEIYSQIAIYVRKSTFWLVIAMSFKSEEIQLYCY